ncbi:MAG TPA: hypothetical protein VJQ54_04285, partial [Candidatus Sulfotelmatobacter sp.]|nr:hypothetical protein [Candidatus Sulfotelmatobacter sp.]
LIFSVAFRLFVAEHESLCGMVLSLSLFKPQYAIALVSALALLQYWNTVKAFAILAVGIAATCIACLGIHGSVLYLNLTRFHGYEAKANMVNLRGLAEALRLPSYTAIPFSIVVFVFFWLIAKGIHDPKLHFGQATVLAMLVSYHGHVYDAALLLIPGSLLIQRRTPCWPALLAVTPALYFVWRDAHLFPLCFLGLLMFFALLQNMKLHTETQLTSPPLRFERHNT